MSSALRVLCGCISDAELAAFSRRRVLRVLGGVACPAAPCGFLGPLLLKCCFYWRIYLLLLSWKGRAFVVVSPKPSTPWVLSTKPNQEERFLSARTQNEMTPNQGRYAKKQNRNKCA